MLIAEHRSIVEVAAELGHSPEMCLRTYAHVVRELQGAGKISAEEEINRARVPVLYPSGATEQGA